MLSHKVFELANFSLARGAILPKALVAYKTFGELNAKKTNVILYPTSYGATHADVEWLIGPERILDPRKYFIVIANMFGNGLSSSPSNLPDPFGPGQLDLFTHLDNVRAQRQMLDEVFGVRRLALVYGWSMGAQQAFHWAALYPTSVERIAAVCGSAKTSRHNLVFLEGIRAALTADPAWRDNGFVGRPERGLKAMARVYAGWALSQAFYRQELYREIGYESLEDFLVRDWEASFLKREAANLVSMIETWKRADISDNSVYHGDLEAALGAIEAKTLVMPSATDLYFTPQDSELEARRIKNCKYLPIPSVWGHRAGNPVKNPADEKFIAQAVRELLES
jgi:homoserine O-acetyltransferase/O-succinyltransferase